MNQNQKWRAPSLPALEKRHSNAAMPSLMLVEINPTAVVDGELRDEAYVAEGISTCGAVRETCPVCEGVHLQLVLRQKNVHAEHLLCPKCTRCFDACLENGASVLKT